MLNICWSNVKRELPAIIFLFLIQLWFSYKFPVHAWLGNPLSAILSVLIFILVQCLIVYTFMNIDKMGPAITLQHLKGCPPFRRIIAGMMIAMNTSMYFLAWYFDFWKAEPMVYVAGFAFCWLYFFLLVRAYNRYKRCAI